MSWDNFREGLSMCANNYDNLIYEVEGYVFDVAIMICRVMEDEDFLKEGKVEIKEIYKKIQDMIEEDSDLSDCFEFVEGILGSAESIEETVISELDGTYEIEII